MATLKHNGAEITRWIFAQLASVITTVKSKLAVSGESGWSSAQYSTLSRWPTSGLHWFCNRFSCWVRIRRWSEGLRGEDVNLSQVILGKCIVTPKRVIESRPRGNILIQASQPLGGGIVHPFDSERQVLRWNKGEMKRNRPKINSLLITKTKNGEKRKLQGRH